MQDANSPDLTTGSVAAGEFKAAPDRALQLTEIGQGKPLEGNVFYTKQVDVLGDLHGNKEVNLNKNPDRLKILIGDVPDRGPQSWQRVEEVMKLVQEGRALYGLGNHEALFMGAMVEDKTGGNRDGACLYTWLYNGGYMTAVGAGVNMGEIDQLIETQILSPVFQLRKNDLIAQYISQGVADADAKKYADLQARQEFFTQYIRRVEGSKPEKGVTDYDAKLAEYQQKRAKINTALEATLIEVRSNTNLQRWNQLLIDHGLMYAAVDDSLNTHAAILPDKKYGQYGVGLEGIDTLQSKVRGADTEAIYFLALDDDSPLWTREEYLEIMANPQKASDLRAKLNEQAAKQTATRPAFKVELINSGHTPVDRPEVIKSAAKTVSLERPADPKIVLLDYHAQESGVQAAMRMDLDPKTGKVAAKLINAVDETDLAAKGGAKVSAEWQVEGKIAETIEGAEDDEEAKAAKENELRMKIATAMVEELKVFSRESLTLLEKGGDVSSAISEYGQNLITEAEGAGQEGRPDLTEAEKSAKITLGYDLQIGALQLKKAPLFEAALEARERSQSKKFQVLSERIGEIDQQIETLTQEKAEKVKIGTSNPLTEFAQAFGASGKEAQGVPLVAVSDKIAEAIIDPKKRVGLIQSLKDSNYFTEEQINDFEKFLKSEHLQKIVKEQGKKAAKVAGGMGLFMLLMAWLASKQGKGGRQAMMAG